MAWPPLLLPLFVVGVVGCRPADIPLPTLAPTLSRPTASATPPPGLTPTVTQSVTPTDQPAATLTVTVTLTDTIPAVTRAPTALASATRAAPTIDSATIPPPEVIDSNGALTITLNAAQINQALTRRFATQPLPGFSSPPHAELIDGGVQLTLNMTAAEKPITLTLTLTAQPTTTGTQLDIRAVALTPLKGVTTLQVKPAQKLLADVLTALMQQYAASANFDMTYVAVNTSSLTLSLITH